MKRTLIAAALGALACTAAPAFAQPLSSEAAFQATTLTLSSSGETRQAPDQASINLGVMTEARTAAEALRQNNTRMNAVIAALRRQGIAERDIQTSGITLNAQYDYRENQPPVLRGYQAANQVTITVNQLDRLGAAVDAVVAAGANQINGVSFGIRNTDAAADEARRTAVRNLQRKAELYAQAAGMRLARLVNITESGGYVPNPPMPMAGRAMAMDARQEATPVQPGEVLVRVDVTATYELAR